MRTGIVAFAFGTPSDLLSNRHLAIEVLDQDRGPVFTQPAIGAADHTRDDVTYIHEPGKPSPTYRVALAAAKWAQANGYENLLIAAAPAHLGRCMRDMEWALEEIEMEKPPTLVPFSEEHELDPMWTWFCPESGQWWTRSWWQWLLREIPIHMLPRDRYTRMTR